MSQQLAHQSAQASLDRFLLPQSHAHSPESPDLSRQVSSQRRVLFLLLFGSPLLLGVSHHHAKTHRPLQTHVRSRALAGMFPRVRVSRSARLRRVPARLRSHERTSERSGRHVGEMLRPNGHRDIHSAHDSQHLLSDRARVRVRDLSHMARPSQVDECRQVNRVECSSQKERLVARQIRSLLVVHVSTLVVAESTVCCVVFDWPQSRKHYQRLASQ